MERTRWFCQAHPLVVDVAFPKYLGLRNSLSGEVTLRGIKEYQDMAGNKKFRTDLAKAYLGTDGGGAS